MNKVFKQNNQTILDLCLQYCGTIEALFEFIKLNSLTEIDISTQEYYIPPVLREKIVKYYQDNDLEVASIDRNFYNLFSNDFNCDFNEDFPVTCSGSEDFDNNDFDINDFG